jgi:Protein of unknown function (DUF3619)
VNFATPQRPHPSPDDLQVRLALQLTARLSEQAGHLPHDIAERLRVAREQAVERGRLSRRLNVAPAVLAQASGTAVLSGPPSLWLRLASLLPLLVLAAGMVLIEQANVRDEISAAAEIDAALLADDLPPAAYLDPGFSEFLKAPVGP